MSAPTLLSAPPVTVVQVATSTATTLTFSAPITAGNTVIFIGGVLVSGSPVLDSPTLDGHAIAGAVPIWNDTGHKAIYVAGSNNVASPAWILPNLPAGTTIGFGVNNISYNAGFIAYEVAGLGPSPIVDVSVENRGIGATAIDSGATANTTIAPAFILGCSACDQSPSAAAAGFNCTFPTPNSWAGYQIATTPGNSYRWTQPVSNGDFTAGVASIAATTPSTPPPPAGFALLNECAQEVEKVIVAWLQRLRRSGSARQVGDPLPFTLVTHITGIEDIDIGLAEPTVTIKTLSDKALGWANAANETQLTHRAMAELARYHDNITLNDGTIVNVDYVSVFQSPIWVPYDDTQILCKAGRYTIGLSYDPVP